MKWKKYHRYIKLWTMEKNVIAIAAEGHYDKNEKLLMSWDFLYSIITIVREETENRARYEQFVQNKELLDKIDCYLNEI